MADKQINDFTDGSGQLLDTTNVACQQVSGGNGSTQKIQFAEIKNKTIEGITQEFTGGKSLQSNSSTKAIEESAVTNTELSYLEGVTSDIQTQIDDALSEIAGKQPAGNYITELTGEASASGPGNATTTLSTTAVTAKALTGYSVGTNIAIAETDSILQAFGKSQAQINAIINQITLQAINGNGYLELTTGAAVTLTNPMPTFINITNLGASFSLILPPMNNTVDSLKSSPLGLFIIQCTSVSTSQSCFLRNNSNTSTLLSIRGQKKYLCFVKSNATADGDFVFIDISTVTSATAPLTINNNGVLSISRPTNQVIYGSGTAITSSPNLTFNGDVLSLQTVTGGIEIPSMTTAQRIAQTPTSPRMVFDSTISQYFGWNPQSSTWVILG